MTAESEDVHTRTASPTPGRHPPPPPPPQLREMTASSKYHLAIYTSALGRGGAERALLNLANAMVDTEVRVDIVLAKRSQSDYLDKVSPRVGIVDLQASPAIKGFTRLVRYLRTERPQVTLSFEAAAHPMMLAARALVAHDMKCAATIQNFHSREYGTDLTARRRLSLALMARAMPHMDRIVAVSHRVAEDVIANFGAPRDRVEVIFNPIVTPELLMRAAAPPPHSWFDDGGPPIIISVGRLTRQKNYPVLLRAVALLRRKFEARLLILGEGEEREALEAMAAELGISEAISFPGFVENPFSHVARSSVFALSSDWEGLPGVLIEALAVGCPIVSTDCPSGPREILADGRYGRLVPTGDPVALAAALEETLRGAQVGRERLTARAQDFTADRLAVRYRTVLFEVAG